MASSRSASSRAPKKIVSWTFAVRASRVNGDSAALVEAIVPVYVSGSAAPTKSPRWP
jgi:hypothetical protein